MIDREHLYSKGLSSVDVNLIASARLADTPVWTKDKALFREADRLGVAAIL
jgi:predicted nucleic acid-binding protein